MAFNSIKKAVVHEMSNKFFIIHFWIQSESDVSDNISSMIYQQSIDLNTVKSQPYIQPQYNHKK